MKARKVALSVRMYPPCSSAITRQVLIPPLVAGTLEDYAAAVAPPALETARGLGLPRRGKGPPGWCTA